jgi:hypothetical protein
VYVDACRLIESQRRNVDYLQYRQEAMIEVHRGMSRKLFMIGKLKLTIGIQRIVASENIVDPKRRTFLSNLA